MSDFSATHNSQTEPVAPYENGIEHLLDEMSPIRQLIEHQVQRMTKHFESEVQSPFRGYGITPSEAMEYVRQREGP